MANNMNSNKQAGRKPTKQNISQESERRAPSQKETSNRSQADQKSKRADR